MSKEIQVGLALGGGGARGLAHLGVLKVLEDRGIVCDLVAGTSFGSIAGAMYAQCPKIDTIRRRVCEILTSEAFKRTQLFFLKRHYEEKKQANFISNLRSYLETGLFFGISLRRSSFIRESDFLNHIGLLLEDRNIEETVIPFVAVATDLIEGDEVVLSSGPIRRGVAASCAIPGVFPPITIGEWRLIDGGWTNSIPVSPLKQMGADFIIAVDTSEDDGNLRHHNTGLEIVLRAGEITRRLLSQIQMKNADIVIRPDIGGIHWSDFQRYEEAFQKGEEAAFAKIDELTRLLAERRGPCDKVGV